MKRIVKIHTMYVPKKVQQKLCDKHFNSALIHICRTSVNIVKGKTVEVLNKKNTVHYVNLAKGSWNCVPYVSYSS